jgi:putative endonuclease
MLGKRQWGLGSWGENQARQYLENLGYRICEQNYRQREGEIDLVVQDGETLVFVEVKARTSDEFGSPEDSLTRKKFQRIETAARTYLLENSMEDSDWRIDMIAIECNKRLEVLRIDHYKFLEYPEQ